MPALKKLLIVDDNKVNRQILHKILSRTYEVIEAENGKDALEILYNCYESISAVLLDIVMPVMDGYEVLDQMGKNSFLSKIPVIVTTGTNDQGAEVKALSLGAHDFLMKPYKPAIILHRLANTIKLRETAALVNAVEKDELTGVYNKEFFYKKAEKLLRDNETQKYDIICVDIERFKLVNDLYGMAAGDELLKYIADLAQSGVGETGLCGRVGADKFAYLIPHQESYCEEMFKAAIVAVNKFPLNITINLCYGIYNIEDINVPINVMCDRALIACSSIKGKYDVHYAYYTDGFRDTLLSEQMIVDGMKNALVQRQFQVYYQPKYDLFTDSIAGAEALVRWNHPEKGLMSPTAFIPLFERNGFIADLDLYIWEEVCRQLRVWIDLGYPVLPISVNVSRTDIYNPDLAQILRSLVEKYNLTPEYLHLEITETAYTENPDQIISTVQELRKQGFIIEMDDFGAGYSSLNMLSALPIHVLKLDMKFIQSETAKRNHKNILSFIISLAKWLNLQVVAEGVETATQVQMLKSMDCDFAQGYFYAKPMPVAKFESLLVHSQKNGDFKKSGCRKRRKENITIQKSQSDRVMVVADDREVNRTVLREIFGELYNIVEAANGQDAYAYITKNYAEIDIILLDLVMPVMDGFQMLTKLKNDTLLRNIPVVITTQVEADGENRALSMGASDFISKPYSKEVVLRRVSNVMAQSKLRAIERERELAREVEEMRYKAEHDSLTGLYNRATMETLVNNFFVKNEKPNGTFFMLDIDHFKLVNDTYGHDRGDELLIEIAQILTKSFRGEDIVARLGGDEFAVFVPNNLPLVDLKKRAQALCEKMRMKLEAVEISATIGIAKSPIYGFDYQTLYKHADTALLAAKRLGKNQYKIFDTHMEMPSPTLYRNMDWLLDETSDAIVICDTENYEILYLNHVATEIAGKDKSLCIGHKCYEVLWGKQHPCSHCISWNKLTQDYLEQEVDDENTGEHYIIRDKLMEWDGKLARIQYIQNNTLRHRFRCELQRANERITNLLSSLQACLVKCLTDDAWTVIEANDKFYEVIGYSIEEFKERFQCSLAAIIEPNYLKYNRQQLQRQLQFGNKIILHSCFVHAQGTLIPVREKTILVTESDGNSYYYATYMCFEDLPKRIPKDEGDQKRCHCESTL